MKTKFLAVILQLLALALITMHLLCLPAARVAAQSPITPQNYWQYIPDNAIVIATGSRNACDYVRMFASGGWSYRAATGWTLAVGTDPLPSPQAVAEIPIQLKQTVSSFTPSWGAYSGMAYWAARGYTGATAPLVNALFGFTMPSSSLQYYMLKSGYRGPIKW